MLAGALGDHESALRASLQSEYGLRLLPGVGELTEPHRTPQELADLVEHLPAGCAYGRALGGHGAMSNESLMLRQIEFNQRDLAWQNAGGKGKRPEPFPLPRPAGEEEQTAAAALDKGRRWRERQARTSAD